MLEECTLLPIEGGYQKPLKASVIRKSATQIVVIADGQMHERKFDINTRLEKGKGKNDFPRRKLVLSTEKYSKE
ncbi:MAG: hypothetical protein HAW67_07680 [Endozoicomonadaceae bacterium]|nr:hypothetical protein [Endozoicomonadaceae bacterium]